MTTTPVQADRILDIGKWLLRGLGLFICLIFWATFYGTSFLVKTNLSIDTLGRNVNVIKANQAANQAANDKHFEKIDNAQSDMKDDIKWLLEHLPPKQTREWKPKPGYITQVR